MGKRWSFEAWMEAVDRVSSAFGIDYRDMPDVSFSRWWENDVTPASAFRMARREWGAA